MSVNRVNRVNRINRVNGQSLAWLDRTIDTIDPVLRICGRLAASCGAETIIDD